MIRHYFENIRVELFSTLKTAKFDIYVAVAWITDIQLWEILLEKAQDGITTQVVLIDDEINRSSGIDFDKFVEEGVQIFWEDHHHKFCIIDRKILVTGSYNWTYKASKRLKRENILIINDEDQLLQGFSTEYRLLLKEASKHKLPKKVEIIETEKVIREEVIKEVERRPSPYRKSGKFYCGICHSRLRPVKSPQHMVGIAFQSCKSCNIYINEQGEII